MAWVVKRPGVGGLRKVVPAFNKGDCATDLSEFQPLAEQGDVNAQFNFGVMYFEGG